MSTLTVKQAESNEIDWVNAMYDAIGFVKSNYENEYILIAKVDNENAGLGRLVKIDDANIELGGIYTFSKYRGLGVAECIVTNLLELNPFKESIVWCLPFENLINFYTKFGFITHQNNSIPTEIIEKLEWCNANTVYTQKVVLLSKNEI